MKSMPARSGGPCCSLGFAICALLSADNLTGAEVVIVENRDPRATIVIAEKPTEQALQAAQILAEYVKRISGAALPIAKETQEVTGTRILVGRSEAVRGLGLDVSSGFTHHMNEEGFVIKTVGKDSDSARRFFPLS